MTAAAGFEIQEQKEPKFIEFKDGEYAEGVLASIQAIEIAERVRDEKTGDIKLTGKKSKAVRYVLDEGEVTADGVFTPSGESCCFLGTYRINEAIRMNHLGRYVAIRCEGVDKSVTRNGNAMKKFRIGISNMPVRGMGTGGGQSVAAQVNPEITNDDIPF